MKCLYITLIILSLNASQAGNVLSFLSRSHTDIEETKLSHHAEEHRPHAYFHDNNNKNRQDARDARAAKLKAQVLNKVRTHEMDINAGDDLLPYQTETQDRKQMGREYFHMDPVLNELRRSRKMKTISPARRQNKVTVAISTSDQSSSLELKNWMDEWDELWMQKKFEALNSTQHRGDVVNMAAARPWGVPCGDPNQHDVPWGTCTLPAECDAEYRVYRGDYFCGRTQYVCCSLLNTNYDMYEGLDVSFDASSFATDSDEKPVKDSKEEAMKRKAKEKKRRQDDREKRKKKIQNNIKQIVKEINKILNRAFRNGTTQRKKKTKELKKFVEDLKKSFKKERHTIVNLHEYEMVKIDDTLSKKLDQVKDVNYAFMNNDTYRDIIINGTVNKAKLMKLLRTHPELGKLLQTPLPVPDGRRLNIDLDDEVELEEDNPSVIEYDVEYGQLYF